MQAAKGRTLTRCLRVQVRGKWTYVEPETLHAETFDLKTNKAAATTLDAFARQLEAGFLNAYKETLRLTEELTPEAAHNALQDNDLLPAADRELMLPLFQFALNNIGTADGLCRYGITTRGFELKMLNSIFTYLNFKTYGMKYGAAGDDIYDMSENPDPSMTYGYFTLGLKEAAIWALRVALKRFDVPRIPGRTEGMHAYFPTAYHAADDGCVIDNPAVFDVGNLLSIKHTSAPASLEKCLQDIVAKRAAYEAARSRGEDAVEPSFFIALPLQCSTCGGTEEPDCLRRDITRLRAAAKGRLFLHVQTETFDDVLAMGNGYNLLQGQEPKYYAFPPMVHTEDFKDSGDFFVDSIAVGRALGSMQSALLITTMRCMKEFTDVSIPYIESEDASIVGSSNGHFLFFDNYFYARFPLSITTDLRLLHKDLPQGASWKDTLAAYMGMHNLSELDRASYRGLLEYLVKTYRKTFGYPANALFSDTEDAMQRMHNVMLQQKLLMNMDVKCDEYFDMDTLVDASGTSYVRRFVTETIDYFKEVLFPTTKEHYTGLITTGGTEGMYTCVFLASKKFADTENAYLFCTKEAHYCVPKAASIFGFTQIEVATTDEASGDMDVDDLYYKIRVRQQEAAAKGQGKIKVVVVCNVASTVKGSTDSLRGVYSALNDLGIGHHDRFLVTDGACQGGFFPFLEQGPDVMPFMRSPTDPDYVEVDGVCVSGHKFPGSPFPSGMVFFKRSDAAPLLTQSTGLSHEQLLVPEVLDEALWEQYDKHGTVVTGKKNGYYAATLWKRVQESKNQDGMKKLALNCDAVATYAVDELEKAVRETGIRPYRNKSGANIIVLNPLPRKELLDKYGLATEGTNAHIVVMPHVSKQLIDDFIVDLKKSHKTARRGNRLGTQLERTLGVSQLHTEEAKAKAASA